MFVREPNLPSPIEELAPVQAAEDTLSPVVLYTVEPVPFLQMTGLPALFKRVQGFETEEQARKAVATSFLMLGSLQDAMYQAINVEQTQTQYDYFMTQLIEAQDPIRKTFEYEIGTCVWNFIIKVKGDPSHDQTA